MKLYHPKGGSLGSLVSNGGSYLLSSRKFVGNIKKQKDDQNKRGQ